MMNKVYAFIVLISISLAVQAQKVGVKTNLLYGAYTYTPNLSLEIATGGKTTLELGGGYNPWHLNDRGWKKQVHWLGQAEFRYWFCRRFNGHFLGVHALGSHFNINKTDLPLLLGKDSEKYRFQGYAAGAGLSYGYQWILGTRWNLEANIGVGYARLNYDKYDECATCDKKLGTGHRNYVGPTKAAISIIYIIK